MREKMTTKQEAIRILRLWGLDRWESDFRLQRFLLRQIGIATLNHWENENRILKSGAESIGLLNLSKQKMEYFYHVSETKKVRHKAEPIREMDREAIDYSNAAP